jgi:hypothetical protein
MTPKCRQKCRRNAAKMPVTLFTGDMETNGNNLFGVLSPKAGPTTSLAFSGVFARLLLSMSINLKGVI